MASVDGRQLALSPPRRWITDLMRVSRGMPIITFERRMALAPLAAARKASPIAWPLLFVKAFALVAARRPELRRAYVPLPWPHLFECAQSRCSLALEREYHGEAAVVFGMLNEPANQSLIQLQAHLDHWKREALEDVSDFRRLIRYSKLPGPLRRILWWHGHSSGRRRARNFGTFGLSVTAASGATALNLIAPVASTLNYGPFDAEHRLDVRLHFDHRVYDGMTAARALAEIEEVLLSEILAEIEANPASPPVVSRL